ncbi:sensor domain-containing diguanylate cyclase [Sphingomonas sp. CARO-RG-8B-R24-01]|uniref:sensor domain-containing diguanylate cyclase n=1 Tax=Sphingomonas sp. CARO-RG-8B-R24-01 TaxID=2914831 RepID=UPI001F57ED75|nr:sensor domain-containing diguanylate cyclase [Sphingomonas sp. CARO-RG-8B-R24-01]
MTSWRTPSEPKAAFLLGIVFFLAAAASVSFARFDGGVAYVWGAAGLLLARLATLPVRRWALPLFWCGIACVLEIGAVGIGWRAIPALTPVLLLEPVVAALLLRRVLGRGLDIETVRGMIWFIGLAGIVAPFVSGIFAAAVVSIFVGAPYWSNFVHWFVAHGLGAVLVTPVAAAVINPDWLQRLSRWKRKDLVANGSLMLAVTATAFFVFYQKPAPILFLPLLPMVLATVRGGRLAAIASTVIVGSIGAILTAHGRGPINLMPGSIGEKSLLLQGFIACSVLLVLPVASLLTQRRIIAERWRESDARYRTIADSLSDAIIDVGPDGTVRYASSAIAGMTGLSSGAVMGSNARDFVFAEDQPLLALAYRQALEAPGQAVIVQYRGARDTGVGRRWFEASIRAVTADGESLGVVGSIRDISDRKNLELSLTREARLDPLTGLANRRAFVEHLERLCMANGAALPNGRHGSLAILDLDHFKAINDRYGHPVGDQVLQAIAAEAMRFCRAHDLVARIGGEEFCVIFGGATMADAEAAGNRLRRAIRSLRIPLDNGLSISVTASIGLAEIVPAMPALEILKHADAALYEAKRQGRDRLRIAA